MLLSKHIEEMKRILKKEGDMEVTMIATTLNEGYSTTGGMSDVFESTIESNRVIEKPFGREKKVVKRLQLMWQT